MTELVFKEPTWVDDGHECTAKLPHGFVRIYRQGEDFGIEFSGDDYAHVRGPREGIHTIADIKDYAFNTYKERINKCLEEAHRTVEFLRNTFK